ncbi:pheromone A receptor-domain-containing protein [Collybia nuda]|uniref:Pheromone A receptor-domain-containing protein n=1 Tax=Collybia nuda TaxID=64659 RepID=A0A9P6CPW8_9AGAR|nr:pheromone A receptor-domain-containing protein [Collybia nuda]
MRPELPVISFVCAALLAVFLPVRRVRCNVANLAIVSWLVGCNIVHGINALVWAGNVDIHIPVWCDIVTKLLLGATVALPGACLCISRNLELVASTRMIFTDPRSRRNGVLFDLLFCYVLPILYMILHIIVQDHRFDLVEDFGCSASIHPSTIGLIIMWLPPMIICSASFILSGLAVHNSFRLASARFTTHLESRSNLTSSLFVRRIATSFFTTGALFIVTLFSVFTISGFKPWTSWVSVHSQITVISIVQIRPDVRSIQLVWWGVPVVSLVYIILSFTIGEELRDSAKWIHKVLTTKPKPKVEEEMLPTHSAKSVPDMISRPSSLIMSTPRPKPQALDLKSGWDDTLDPKKPKLWSLGRKSPNSFRSTNSPSPSPTSTAEDDAFMVSTLDYVVSPTAKSLGIGTPTALLSPPPVYSSPRKPVYEKQPISIPSPTNAHSTHSTPPPRNVPDDVQSVISSVFDAAWPHPPVSTPSSLSRHTGRSRSSSPVSLEPSFGCPLYPSITPPHRQSRPFQGSSVSSLPEAPASPSPQPKKGLPKRPSVSSLRRTLSGEKFSVYAPGEVIYMTVVKEIV